MAATGPIRSRALPQGHHHISHHRNQPESLSKLAIIDTWHVTQFAYFLEKLKSVKEGEGTLLDNSMIVYGAGISDGNEHSHDNLPTVLAGRGRRNHHARPSHPSRSTCR